MENIIKCPCCGKEMKISKNPFVNAYRVECNYCHIAVTSEELHNVEFILFGLYRGQYDFEVKYIDGKIEYARIGGGYRPPVLKED